MRNNQINSNVKILSEVLENDTFNKWKTIIETTNVLSSRLASLKDTLDYSGVFKTVQIMKDSLDLYNINNPSIKFKMNLFNNSIKEINDQFNAELINNKKLESVLLKNKLLNDSLIDNIIIEEKYNKDFDIYFSDKLKDSYQLFYKYILYAYKDSDYSIVEEYDKSIINNIHEVGLNINNLIYKINELYNNKKGVYFFDMRQSLIHMIGNITKYAVDEKAFSELMNLVYKGFIECCGNDKNRIYTVYEKFGKDTLDLIKDIRGYFVHEETVVEKRVVNTYIFFHEILDVNVPVKESDFLKLQYELYKRIEEMLKNIYDDMNINL